MWHFLLKEDILNILKNNKKVETVNQMLVDYFLTTLFTR